MSESDKGERDADASYVAEKATILVLLGAVGFAAGAADRDWGWFAFSACLLVLGLGFAFYFIPNRTWGRKARWVALYLIVLGLGVSLALVTGGVMFYVAAIGAALAAPVVAGLLAAEDIDA